MLLINHEPLPNTGLTYLAFRISFQDTLERIVLARQMGTMPDGFGFLTEVPFLQTVPPHVQLDLLADTWSKHWSSAREHASLLDESVIYAACETAARIAEEEPSIVAHSIFTGPQQIKVSVDTYLPGEFRNLHLNLANEGDFLLISQFEDIPPEEAEELKQQYRLDQDRIDEMFDALGRWAVAPNFVRRLAGLVTEKELVRASFVIGEALQSNLKRVP